MLSRPWLLPQPPSPLALPLGQLRSPSPPPGSGFGWRHLRWFPGFLLCSLGAGQAGHPPDPASGLCFPRCPPRPPSASFHLSEIHDSDLSGWAGGEGPPALCLDSRKPFLTVPGPRTLLLLLTPTTCRSRKSFCRVRLCPLKKVLLLSPKPYPGLLGDWPPPRPTPSHNGIFVPFLAFPKGPGGHVQLPKQPHAAPDWGFISVKSAASRGGPARRVPQMPAKSLCLSPSSPPVPLREQL